VARQRLSMRAVAILKDQMAVSLSH
jgi:hypothetical protein